MQVEFIDLNESLIDHYKSDEEVNPCCTFFYNCQRELGMCVCVCVV